jgi:hypothetical protein
VAPLRATASPTYHPVPSDFNKSYLAKALHAA